MSQASPEPAAQTAPIGDLKGIPDYPVKFHEILLVGLGAGVLVLVATLELVNQFFTKIKKPEQAEAIVEQVVQYEMPGGAQGLKSFKTNTEAFALVGNRQNPPNTLLLVSRAPVEKNTEKVTKNLVEELDIPAALVGTWQQSRSETKNKRFCQRVVPVRVRSGSYRLIERPGQVVKMHEYMIVRSQKETIDTIQIFGIGAQGQQRVEAVFQSLECPPVE